MDGVPCAASRRRIAPSRSITSIHVGGTATILYPTTHAQAKEARIEVRDPLLGGRRALVVLRPVSLDRLEGLVSTKQTAAVLRERRSFASELVFGTKPL